MRKNADFDDEKLQDLQDGADATSAILLRANEAIDNETLIVARSDLKGRVDDWKGHNMERFGRLLVYGIHTVLKGENPQKEVEREVRIRSCILLSTDRSTSTLIKRLFYFFAPSSNLLHGYI